MARTRDHARHAVRRDTFVEAAQGLVMTRGYEDMSVQDILDSTGASRGAFYHYFEGKADLLQAVIERMVDDAWPMLEAIVGDPATPAAEKFSGVFAGLASFKAERRELVLGILRIWMSDDNAIVREKWRDASVERLVPLLVAIFEQGRRDGTITAGDDPEITARVIVSLMLGAQAEATRLYLERQSGTVSVDEVHRRLSAYSDAVERLLGLPPGATPLASRELIHQWYA